MSYLDVISENRLLREMLAPEVPSSSVVPTHAVGVGDHPMGPEERSSSLLPTLTPAVQMGSFMESSEESSRASEDLASWSSPVGKEIDEAFSKRDQLTDLCVKQRSERESLLADAREASKASRLKKHIRELQAENVVDNSIEEFKRSEEYRTFINGDTTTLLRYFCLRVATDYPSISSHFTNFVTALGEEEPVDIDDDFGSDASGDKADDES
ncbi:hypothetical protein LIER_18291 [Lithospermum erythrorhizon]|uniref:Uncharacterized protein n=1 Tax=Lithospermum erythrorhizon TaxID=34254 RepID=A0AAV3QEQ7_LITER